MNNLKILYAEDDASNRKVMELSLQRKGLSVDLASNGTEALRLFETNSYDLVILDWYMPGMNGDELARKIRETSPDIGLVAITSDDLGPDVLGKCGFDEVLVKPLVGTGYIERIIGLAEKSRRNECMNRG